MSAYLCDERHIAAVAVIVKALVPNDLLLGSIFDALVLENVRSLQARYPRSPGMWEGADEYHLDFPPIVNLQTPMGRAQALKALNCYAYQSCEHDGWNDSMVNAWIEAAKVPLGLDPYKVPSREYEAATWGF